MTTLADIRDPASVGLFPHDVLHGCTDALVLFAAAWLGRQDAVWIADAGLAGTCVDNDGAVLDRMRPVYPDGWEFVCADVYEFGYNTSGQWDVVTLDCPSDQFGRCADHVQLWCDLARRAVILGTGARTKVEAPDGWALTGRLFRSMFAGGVYWTVLEPV